MVSTILSVLAVIILVMGIFKIIMARRMEEPVGCILYILILVLMIIAVIEKFCEHVKAYMDIQKIRNTDLFDYQIEIQDITISSQRSHTHATVKIEDDEHNIKYVDLPMGKEDSYKLTGKYEFSVEEHKIFFVFTTYSFTYKQILE